MPDLADAPTHVVIPDTQVKPGVPTDHLRWIGQYIVDHFAGHPALRVIHLGDHADMPSLSSYDKGKRAMEGRRVLDDLQAANAGFLTLNTPLLTYNQVRRDRKERTWTPSLDFLLGNHEWRIVRATEDDPQMDGFLGLDSLAYEDLGWTVHDFLEPVVLDGVAYAHYWANPMTGKPLGGMASTRLKNLGHSFTMGHQQTLDYATRYVLDADGAYRSQHALIAGACYIHDEDYKGYQGNGHWRGIVVCHQVENGSYDPMFLSLDYLCRRYEGVRFEEFKREALRRTL